MIRLPRIASAAVAPTLSGDSIPRPPRPGVEDQDGERGRPGRGQPPGSAVLAE